MLGNVRLQVVPANRSIYRAALSEGLIETLHDAGAVVFPPSAGSNQAVNMGAMSEEEVMISNQARIFRPERPSEGEALSGFSVTSRFAWKGRITDLDRGISHKSTKGTRMSHPCAFCAFCVNNPTRCSALSRYGYRRHRRTALSRPEQR